MERADIAIIGTGPAGVSAAITAKVRGKTVLLFGSRELSSKLTKAHKIQNYPGLPDIDGAQLAQAFKKHLDVLEIPITEKQVTAVYAMGGYFGIQTPDAMLEASSVILAGGVVMGKTFPKEDELLGRGVSYCATCDAHFYPGKTVAVLGYNAESCREANFLAETAGRLLYFPVVPHEVAVNDHVQVINERPIAILGQTHAEGVHEIIERYRPGEDDPHLKVLQAAHISDDEYFSHMVLDDLNLIIRDIREAHKKDSESAPQTTVADELKENLEAVENFKGSRDEKLVVLYCKQLGINYKNLSDEEFRWLIRILKKSKKMGTPISQRKKR